MLSVSSSTSMLLFFPRDALNDSENAPTNWSRSSMVETSNASFSVQWSSGEYLRSVAQSRNLMSCTLIAAMSFESPLVLAPRSLPFPFGPATAGGGATVPSPVRTPQAGALGAGRAAGARGTRPGRRGGRGALGAALAGPQCRGVVLWRRLGWLRGRCGRHRRGRGWRV